MRKVAVTVALFVATGLAAGCRQTSTTQTAEQAEKIRTKVADLRARAERGEAEAQYGLGWMYSNGQGVPKDNVQALSWLRQAAAQGHAGAQFGLAWMYGNGQGVPKDNAQALSWLRQAAAQGHAGAQNGLGAMYGNGEGVPRDDALAVSWFRKAAEQGEAEAQRNLGEVYSRGRGVPQDFIESHKWFHLAETRSSGFFQATAARRRRVIEAKMTPDQIAEAQMRAREWTEAFERRQKK